MTSLRSRALVGGLISAVVTILLGLAGLSSYMTAQTNQQFSELLQTRHTQAIVAVANYNQSPENIGRAMGDPIFQRPFSGQYWQVESQEGQLIVSPSLVDMLLPRPAGSEGSLVVAEFPGPDGDMAMALSQWITLEDGTTWHVQVASSRRQLEQDLAALRRNLFTAFIIVACIAVVNALLQVTVVLRPLNALRKDVTARWEHEDGLDASSYPVEVAPLVTDINSLLIRNRDIISRSRRQAADLAHAIKTPSAIMRNELSLLEVAGTEVHESLKALDRLDALLKRSFARMRADGSVDAAHSVTDLDTSLGRMERAFTGLLANVDKTFHADIEPGLRIRMDQSDFEEVMGNLLDNALKWSKGTVRVVAERQADLIVISVHDDGPGISETDIALASQSGQRLDTVEPGTGLGLAIVKDLIHAYEGTLTLDRSDKLGGLLVRIYLKGVRSTRPLRGAGPTPA